MTIVEESKNNCILQSGYQEEYSANSLAAPIILFFLILCRLYIFFLDKSDVGVTINMTAGNSNQFEKYADSLEHVINCINNEVDFGDNTSGEASFRN